MNKIIIIGLVLSIAMNVVLLLGINELKHNWDSLKWTSAVKYNDQANGMRSHIEDWKNGNAWYFEKVDNQPKYMGESLLIKDQNGPKIISNYDLENLSQINDKFFVDWIIKPKITAQQADASEPATPAR